MRHATLQTRTPPVRWILPPWALPLWLAAVVWGWWDRFAQDLGPTLAALAGHAAVAPATLIACALAARLLGWFVEAGFYALAWRALSARLAYLPLVVALASCSLFDLLAHSVRGAWPGAPLAALLAGSTPGPGAGALELGVAGFGLCALARMVCTAVLQARALGRGPAGAFALTCAAVAVTRIATVLSLDLARGRSPW